MKRIPQRTCMGCNTSKNKDELIRIVKDKNENIFIDVSGKANGRGAYICNSVECLEKAIKSKRLEKCFEVKFLAILFILLLKLFSAFTSLVISKAYLE